jgi:hypothetical protein
MNDFIVLVRRSAARGILVVSRAERYTFHDVMAA